MGVIKTKSLFDHIRNLFTKKVKWSDLSEADRKSFSVYMVNRFLSMDMELIGFINMLQPYTMQTLSPEMVYKLYLDLLPKQKGFYSKYIKASKSAKFKDDLISMISRTEEISKTEAIDMMNILLTLNGLDLVSDYLIAYGKTNSEIKKLLKIEK